VSQAATEDEDEDDEGVGWRSGAWARVVAVADGGVWECGGGRLGSRGGGVEFEVATGEEKETCPCTPTMCRCGSRPGLPSRRVAVQGRAVRTKVFYHCFFLF